MSTTAFQHEAGTAMECLSIPITLEKEGGVDQHGRQVSTNFSYVYEIIYSNIIFFCDVYAAETPPKREWFNYRSRVCCITGTCNLFTGSGSDAGG